MWWTKTGMKEDNITVLWNCFRCQNHYDHGTHRGSRNESRLTVTKINIFQFVCIISSQVIVSLSSDYVFKEVSGEGFMSDVSPVFKILKVKFLVRIFPFLVVRFTKKKKNKIKKQTKKKTCSFWVWSWICQNPNTILGVNLTRLPLRQSKMFAQN